MSKVINIPYGASQHKTAGPYSPVLEVECNKIVVISGQVSVDKEGVIHGDDVATQTRLTLLNCEAQLKTAGCTLNDVFKVNVYMTNLEHWNMLNEVYSEMMPDPKPVRTAVQAILLPNIQVEIEMWAAKE